MHSIVINIKDDQLAKQVIWWLEHLKEDGVEIVSIENLEDLKALQATRQEPCSAFE
jgi:predicted HAD superfamily phosphohydrolase YqeG